MIDPFLLAAIFVINIIFIIMSGRLLLEVSQLKTKKQVGLKSITLILIISTLCVLLFNFSELSPTFSKFNFYVYALPSLLTLISGIIWFIRFSKKLNKFYFVLANINALLIMLAVYLKLIWGELWVLNLLEITSVILTASFGYLHIMTYLINLKKQNLC